MKKLIVFVLVFALCATALTSCALIDNLFGPDTLEEIATMYNMSAPTKVVATTVQDFGSFELNCSYELVTGHIDNSIASVYTVTTEELRDVAEGGNTEEVKDMIKSTTKVTEAVEGVGARVNGGDWDPNGTVWTIGRGRMAINLDKDAVENVVYENHTLTFTVPKENVATVLGTAYAEHVSSDVEITIVDDGAVVTSIELHYYLAGDGAHLAESEMTVKVVYTYDLERITLQ
jgi:hypothetical protein